MIGLVCLFCGRMIDWIRREVISNVRGCVYKSWNYYGVVREVFRVLDEYVELFCRFGYLY